MGFIKKTQQANTASTRRQPKPMPSIRSIKMQKKARLIIRITLVSLTALVAILGYVKCRPANNTARSGTNQNTGTPSIATTSNKNANVNTKQYFHELEKLWDESNDAREALEKILESGGILNEKDAEQLKTMLDFIHKKTIDDFSNTLTENQQRSLSKERKKWVDRKQVLSNRLFRAEPQ